jgi:hypothetical protein
MNRQQQLFPIQSNEHDMVEVAERTITNMYSEATRSAFNSFMASTYMNHPHHQQNRLLIAPYAPYLHHPMHPLSAPMSFLFRKASSEALPGHH